VLGILRAALKPGGLVVVVDHIVNPTSPRDITPVANRLPAVPPAVTMDKSGWGRYICDI